MSIKLVLVDLENNRFFGERYYESDNWVREPEEAMQFDSLEDVNKCLIKGIDDDLSEDYTKEMYVYNACSTRAIEIKTILIIK